MLDLRPKVVITSIEKLLDKINNSQNLQSTSCIRILSSYLRNPKKPIKEDDLRNPIKTYQTDFLFIKEDIMRFRQQNMKHECFSVLHPWAYELELVDFKYVMNNDLKPQIMKYFKSNELSIVFWFSFFKNQIGCGSDDFIEAIRQLCEINKLQGFWDKEAASY